MSKTGRYIIRDREQSSIAEAFRALSSAMQEVKNGSDMKTVLFSAVSAGEGDVMTAVNTAVTLAHAGNKVIIVDCDMRHPVLHEIFQVELAGLTNIIMQDSPIERRIQETEISGLQVLTAGSVTGGAVELLSNEKLQSIFNYLKSVADYVIIVCSPLIIGSKTIVSDACIVASKVDGVVMVIASRKVKTQTAKKAVELLKGARARLIGTVLCDVVVDTDFVYYSSVS